MPAAALAAGARAAVADPHLGPAVAADARRPVAGLRAVQAERAVVRARARLGRTPRLAAAATARARLEAGAAEARRGRSVNSAASRPLSHKGCFGSPLSLSMTYLPSALAVLVAYLVGSLSFAVIVSRVMGLSDPRSYGSKNPGATNVLRSGNKAAAVLTLALDALKGYVPVLVALLLALRFGWGETTVAWVGLAAFVGHLWPLFFRFRGGKGVATAAGVLMGLNPWLGLATLVSWLIIAFFFRYSSLASLVAALFAPSTSC
jgi:acyl-phosphate glycerol 3-phosphate acyltransferase